jgi:hypothetical protein
MCLPAFDEPGARETGAKLGRVEFLLGRELLHAAPAVLAKDDNGHNLVRRYLGLPLRDERTGERWNGRTKKEDANSCGVHATPLEHLVFSCRNGCSANFRIARSRKSS